MQQFTVTATDEGVRFDKYLRHLFPDATGGFLYKMLRKKNIVLNDKKASGNEKLKNGDIVSVYFADATIAKFMRTEPSDEIEMLMAAPYELTILYEDDNYLLVDKPVDVLTQKAGPQDISLNEMLLSYLLHTGSVTPEMLAHFRPSVMNRLDYKTTGIVACAKTYYGARMLAMAQREHTLTKRYATLVKGHFTTEGRLTAGWRKDAASHRVTITDMTDDGAKRIAMDITVERHYKEATLLTITLLTGRSHQIRAWMAHLSHPIIGDMTYGDRRFNRRYMPQHPRQLLHAKELVFIDRQTYQSPLPSDFAAVLSQME